MGSLPTWQISGAKVADSDGASIYSDLTEINKIGDILDLGK